VFLDSGIEFPETIDFIDHFARELHLDDNLVIPKSIDERMQIIIILVYFSQSLINHFDVDDHTITLLSSS